jgi:YVTN family beta-propeller protein
MGERPVGIAILPDGKKAYVAHGRANDVRIINTATNKVTATIPLEGERAWWVALTPDSKKLYVTVGRANKVAVIDTATEKVLTMISAGQLPWGVAVSR